MPSPEYLHIQAGIDYGLEVSVAEIRTGLTSALANRLTLQRAAMLLLLAIILTAVSIQDQRGAFAPRLRTTT